MTTSAPPTSTGVTGAAAPPADDVAVGTVTPDRPRGPFLLAVWTILLVLGFAAVLTIGAPLPSAEDALAAAYRPPTPVTEQIAVASADTIVRFQYPAMAGADRQVTRRADLGVDRWVVVYSIPDRLASVRISVEVESGQVSVFYLP